MEIIKYPKTQTLFKRNQRGIIIPDEFALPEFEAIEQWLVTEKIDGTNIRVVFNKELNKIDIFGRTEKSQLHPELTSDLYRLFDKKKLNEIFDKDVILFGEGIGPKVQGNIYKLDKHTFYLFDVFDSKFRHYEELEEIAQQLNLNLVPSLGILSKLEVINLVTKCFSSKLRKDTLAEGVVAISYPLLFDADGNRVKFKLKCSDFRKLLSRAPGWKIVKN